MAKWKRQVKNQKGKGGMWYKNSKKKIRSIGIKYRKFKELP